jgi:hypothetical protein
MKLIKIAPICMIPVLASIGCASGADDDAGATDNAITSSESVDFTASVGAVVVEGKKVCTAAVVDVDAAAKIGPVSAHGRQIVMGGACVGKLKNGFTGAAVFVSEQNGLSISTPIVSFDFETQAKAGLAVGILSEPVAGAEPLELLGASARVNLGASRATILEADENGLLIGASAEIHGGVDFALKTKCTSFKFSAHASVAVGGSISLSDDGLGAAALVRVDGKLKFAAHVDGQCIVEEIGDDVAKVADATLRAANDVGDALNSIGTGKLIGVATTKDQKTTVHIRLQADAKAIRVNGQGHISASADGATCDKIPLLLLGGPCELRPASGFRKGELVSIDIDTHLNLLPDGPDGMHLYISTTNDAAAASPSSGGDNGGG